MKKILVIFTILAASFLYGEDLILDRIRSLITPEMNGDLAYDLISSWKDYPLPAETGIFLESANAINDSLAAPFVYYIPEDYDPHQSKPLLIYLHGLVGIPNFREDPLLDAEENYFTESNEAEWFLLYPMSNEECMWWDRTGTENLEYQIRFLKDRYNIDDNRVYVTGFSDGGSGSFHLALNDPNDYASLYPLNGMLSVGQAVNGLPVYVPNMMNRYTRVINTDLDALYPASEMRKLMDLSISAGADIFYKEYWGIGHDFKYAGDEIPLILADMKLHPRNPFRQEIYWETSLLEYGKCDWIEIVELDTLEQAEDWHVQYNIELQNKRMSFGFYNDLEFVGPGVRVTDIVENSTVAEMGIKKGDVIVAMDGDDADDIYELTRMRDNKERGDSFTLTIHRGTDEIVLDGRFPEPEKFQVFNYNLTSGAVKARYFANQFHVETSRVGKVAIYINPEMVNMRIPVTIYINGEKRTEEIISIDRDFMLENFKQDLDRKALWVSKVELDVFEN